MPDDDCHGETCYRVAGYYDAAWDHTEWMSSVEEAEQAYRRIQRRRNWSQLSIERSDGKLKASPESDEWYDA